MRPKNAASADGEGDLHPSARSEGNARKEKHVVSQAFWSVQPFALQVYRSVLCHLWFCTHHPSCGIMLHEEVDTSFVRCFLRMQCLSDSNQPSCSLFRSVCFLQSALCCILLCHLAYTLVSGKSRVIGLCCSLLCYLARTLFAGKSQVIRLCCNLLCHFSVSFLPRGSVISVAQRSNTQGILSCRSLSCEPSNAGSILPICISLCHPVLCPFVCKSKAGGRCASSQSAL